MIEPCSTPALQIVISIAVPVQITDNNVMSRDFSFIATHKDCSYTWLLIVLAVLYADSMHNIFRL